MFSSSQIRMDLEKQEAKSWSGSKEQRKRAEETKSLSLSPRHFNKENTEKQNGLIRKYKAIGLLK